MKTVEMVGGPEDGCTFQIPTNGSYIDVMMPPPGQAFGIQPPSPQRVARLEVERRGHRFVFVWANRKERDL